MCIYANSQLDQRVIFIAIFCKENDYAQQSDVNRLLMKLSIIRIYKL